MRPKADIASADIAWTERCIGATPEHVGVDLVGADILVPQELIDCVEVLACLKQMVGRECRCHDHRGPILRCTYAPPPSCRAPPGALVGVFPRGRDTRSRAAGWRATRQPPAFRREISASTIQHDHKEQHQSECVFHLLISTSGRTRRMLVGSCLSSFGA